MRTRHARVAGADRDLALIHRSKRCGSAALTTYGTSSATDLRRSGRHTEAEAAAIRAVFEQSGEFAAAVQLRRRFPGIGENVQARKCARTIAGWKPGPLRRLPKRPRLRRVR
jgi:hypothetical protein